jgi:hypothetical protein
MAKKQARSLPELVRMVVDIEIDRYQQGFDLAQVPA